MWQVSAQAAHPSAGGSQLASRHENFGVWEVRKPAIMIDVQVGQHDAFHVPRPNTQRAQLRTDFLVALDSKPDFPAHVRVQRPGGFEEMCRLTRIHHDHAFRMIDDPCVGWKPFGPLRVGKYPETPAQPMSSSFDLRGLDPNGAGLN